MRSLNAKAGPWLSVHAPGLARASLLEQIQRLSRGCGQEPPRLTLFLSCLETLTLSDQTSLLRFLEEEEEEGREPWLLSSSNADLLERVYRGEFLHPLYYRLATLTLRLPPLRERVADLPALAARIKGAGRLTILTGAGVSAASGVPTFRGPDGLWQRYRPEDLATPRAFARDPKLVWEWYDWRRQRIAACRPNRAHEVLAAWSRRYPRFALITQNVDGLHERAGTRSVIRLHGSIWEVACRRRCAGAPQPWQDETVPFAALPPRCPHCGDLIRPAVVWFGESLDPVVIDRALDATACDLFFTVGTSSVVYPAASLVHDAKARGAFTVEINPEATPASSQLDLSIRGAAEDVLPELEALIAG